ncbi:MAG: ABC transporter ATP-binding protein [Actinomycetota bacterium]|nr:ABC transporter ATP-binding protein [Actinomycetota bacterium]
MADAVLEVRDLCVDYATRSAPAKAVERVSFDLHRGEFMAIVGESGCGKSTLLFAIARLLSPPAELTGGDVRFNGTSMVQLGEKQLRALRWRDFSVVMQSAMNALNPVKSIAAQYRDAMRAHDKHLSKAAIEERSREVLLLVGIDPVHLHSYPHQLSGGMRQRAMIAMALLFSPELILMDEPTSALDVVAQRSLMTKVKELQERLGFAIIFVTHDMSLVSNFSDRLAVMYAGQVSEIGPTELLFSDPKHPYTKGLLDAFPSIYGERVELVGIPGSPPDLSDPPGGCHFHPRCGEASERCASTAPGLYDLGDRQVRCLLYADEGTDRG